jgi:hypothetical protein
LCIKSAPGQEKWYTLVCINPYGHREIWENRLYIVRVEFGPWDFLLEITFGQPCHVLPRPPGRSRLHNGLGPQAPSRGPPYFRGGPPVCLAPQVLLRWRFMVGFAAFPAGFLPRSFGLWSLFAN